MRNVPSSLSSKTQAHTARLTTRQPYRVALRDYPKQVVSLIEVESVPGISLLDPRTLSHRRNNFYFSRKTGEPAFVVPCPSECKEFSHNGSKEHFVRSTCKIRGTVRKERSHTTTGFNFKFSTTHGPQGEQSKHEKGNITSTVEPTLILLCVRSTVLTRQRVQRHQTVIEGSQITY